MSDSLMGGMPVHSVCSGGAGALARYIKLKHLGGNPSGIRSGTALSGAAFVGLDRTGMLSPRESAGVQSNDRISKIPSGCMLQRQT